MELIDTHCHLNDPNLSIPVEAAVANAKAAGVVQFVVPGMNLPTSSRAVELAAQYPGICFATVGVHPHEIVSRSVGISSEVALRRLARQPGLVAIGEIGIDYHHYERAETGRQQRDAFAAQLQLAVDCHLPAIVHGRDAYDDVLDVITAHPQSRGVLHSFEASYEAAKTALDRGWLIGITALITYKHSHILKNVIQSLPLDRLMLETDTPYLPPQSIRDRLGNSQANPNLKTTASKPIGARGRNNQPAYLIETATMLAELQGVDLDTVAAMTTTTARQFFNLPKVDR